VSDLWSEEKQTRIVAVFAKGNYSYALETPEGSVTNQLYTWGMGENYVLGSREDDNQYKPYKVHPKMFEELPVLQVGTGTQHVVVLTSDSQEHQNFPRFTDEVLDFRLPPPAPKVPKEKVAPKKKLDNEEDHPIQ
jgi:alpha-tubulin suppressor-like RCC1 family protein